MVGFLFLQAGLGAWAVMYPQVAAILALHFGVSLIAFASVLLTTAFLFEVDGIAALIRRPLPLGFRYAAWGVTAYTYVVVYLGAFVRHVDADESCRGWPLCNGHVIPAFTDKVAVAFTHRVAAAILIAAIVALALWSRRYRARRPDIFRACLMAVGLVVLQAGSGAIVAFTGVDIFSALAHAALVGLLFGSLVYLCSHLVGFGSVEAAPERSAILTAPQAEAAGTPQ
jgi:cytochrome c oxidase assembly protein subunit 15